MGGRHITLVLSNGSKVVVPLAVNQEELYRVAVLAGPVGRLLLLAEGEEDRGWGPAICARALLTCSP